MNHRAEPTQRVASRSDAEAISALMRDSVRELFPHFYDERQTASAVTHVASLDVALIEDGTYYVVRGRRRDRGLRRLEPAQQAARRQGRRARRRPPARPGAPSRPACGRCSCAATGRGAGSGRAIIEACAAAARAEGFTTLALMATLPGEPLYRACGFRETGRTMVVTPDGVALEGVTMERAIEQAEPARAARA